MPLKQSNQNVKLNVNPWRACEVIHMTADIRCISFRGAAGHSIDIKLKAKTPNCVVWFKCHINIHGVCAISAVTFSNVGLGNRHSLAQHLYPTAQQFVSESPQFIIYYDFS